MAVPFRISRLDFTPTPSPAWTDAVFAQSIGVWLALSPEGASTADKVLRSTNGLTWAEHTLPTGAAWTALVWSETAGLFAAFCTNNSGVGVATSPDGITWTTRHAQAALIRSCVYAQSKFIGVGGLTRVIGANVFSKANFALSGVGVATRSVNINMAVTRTMFVGIVGNTTDNVTGVTYNSVAMTLVQKVQVSGDRFIYLFKLLSPSLGGSFALTVTFSATNQGSAIYISGFSDAGDVTSSTTNTGSGTAISTSRSTTEDGEWLLQFSGNAADSAGTAGANTTVRQTSDGQGGTMADSNGAKSPPPGPFSIAVNVSSSNWAAITAAFRPFHEDGLITSSTGLTWVESYLANDTLQGLAYSPALSLYCAISAGGSNGGGLGLTYNILTSPDGVTWTYRDLGTAIGADLSATGNCVIVWADDLNLFVVVLSDGTVRKSADGVTWSAMTLPVSPTIPLVLGVTWVKRLGMLIFFTEADSAGYQPLLYSDDGVTIIAADYLTTDDTDGDWSVGVYSTIHDRMVVFPTFNAYALLVEFGPDLIEIVPPSGDIVGGNTVQLIGTGFLPGMQVVFDNVFATDVDVISETLATCTVPAHVIAGLVDVTVTNTDDRFDSEALIYEYQAATDPHTGEPEIFPGINWMGSGCAPGSIVPNHGTMAGGTIVTIHGQGFRPGSTVLFGGNAATNVVIDGVQPWPALVLAKGPDAWWRLEEASAALVLTDQMGAHDATLSSANGKTSVRGGLSYSVSKGIQLSSGSRGFECVASSGANFSPGIPVFSGAGTIEFLLRPVAGGPTYGAILGDVDFCNGIYVYDDGAAIRISFESDISGFTDQTNSAPLVPGQLYHIALRLDGAGGGQWVIDGIADAAITQVNITPTADVTLLFDTGGFPLSCELIDELAVYLTELTVPMLLNHATHLNATYAALVLADGAEAYWRFEEDGATAVVLVDSAGNGFDAATVAAGRTSVTGGLSDGHVHAVITFGINLTGVYSIEFLINPVDVGALQVLLAGIAPLGFLIDSGLTLRAEVAHVVLSDTPLVAGAISHVVFTASGSIGRWYINGVAHGSGAWDNTDDVVLQRMLAGTVGGSPLVCNVLDEVVVHSVELSAADVLAHFQAARQWVSGTFITVLTPPHQTGPVDVEVLSP